MVLTAGSGAGSSSCSVQDPDMSAQLYDSLTNPSSDKELWKMMEHTFLVGQDRDDLVIGVVRRLVRNGDVEALGKLFAVLRDGRGCGTMRIRTPNDVPASCVFSFFYPRSWETCRTFVECGLDLKKRYRHVFDNGLVGEFDLWLWVAASSASEVAAKLHSAGVNPDPELKFLRWTVFQYGASGIARALFNTEGSPEFLDIAIETFRYLYRAAEFATTGASLRGMIYGTGLVAYLARSGLRQAECRSFAQELVAASTRANGEVGVDVDELCARSSLMFDLERSFELDQCFGHPLETPLIEAARSRSVPMTRLLLKCRAEIDIVGHCGMTAYGMAKALKHEEVMAMLETQCGLIDEGKRPRFRDWWKGDDASLSWPADMDTEAALAGAASGD